MASKWHINPATGKAGRCTAKTQCRFGVAEGDHHPTEAAARAAYEEKLASRLLPTASREASSRKKAKGSPQEEVPFTPAWRETFLKRQEEKDPAVRLKEMKALLTSPEVLLADAETIATLHEEAYHLGWVPFEDGSFRRPLAWEEEEAVEVEDPEETLEERWRTLLPDHKAFLERTASILPHSYPKVATRAVHRVLRETRLDAEGETSTPQEATRHQLALLREVAPQAPLVGRMAETREALLRLEEAAPTPQALADALLFTGEGEDEMRFEALLHTRLTEVQRPVGLAWKPVLMDHSQASPQRQLSAAMEKTFSGFAFFRNEESHRRLQEALDAVVEKTLKKL